MCTADLRFTGGKNDIGAGTDTDFIGVCTPGLTFENRAVYEIMWKNVVQPDRPHDNMAHAHCVPVN